MVDLGRTGIADGVESDQAVALDGGDELRADEIRQIQLHRRVLARRGNGLNLIFVQLVVRGVVIGRAGIVHAKSSFILARLGFGEEAAAGAGEILSSGHEVPPVGSKRMSCNVRASAGARCELIR